MSGEWAWNVEAGSRTYNVTVSDAGSGRHAVRADGRTVARPFGEADVERSFTLEGVTCHVVRNDDGSFELQVDEPLPPQRTFSTPRNSDLRESVFQARAVMWGIVILLFAAPFFWLVINNTYTRQARRRVEAVLAGMTKETDAETLGLWARNTRRLADMRELGWAADHFDDWLHEKGFTKPITSYHVISVREVKDAEVPTVTVHVVIDGRDLTLLVPERRPISWAKE